MLWWLLGVAVALGVLLLGFLWRRSQLKAKRRNSSPDDIYPLW